MAKQKLRKYELIYLVQPEAEEDARKKVEARVDLVIEQFEGIVVEREDWGKRKLAYEIRKFNKAYYTYLVLVGPTGMTQEIERILRMLDDCFRFMTIKLEIDLDGDIVRAELAEKQAAKAEADKVAAAEKAVKQAAAEKIAAEKAVAAEKAAAEKAVADAAAAAEKAVAAEAVVVDETTEEQS